MTRSIMGKILLSALGCTFLLATPTTSDAALLDWLFPFRQQRLERRAQRLNRQLGQSGQLNTSYYGSLPAYRRNPAIGNWNGWGQIPTTANFRPTTAYRTVWAPVPVTSFRPVGPNSQQACSSYSWQARRVPYTTWQPVQPTQFTAPAQTAFQPQTNAVGSACGCNGTAASGAGWQTLSAPSTLGYASGFGQGVASDTSGLSSAWSTPPATSGLAPTTGQWAPEPSTCQSCAPAAPRSSVPADQPPRLSTGYAPSTNALTGNAQSLRATPWVPLEQAQAQRPVTQLQSVPGDVIPQVPASSRIAPSDASDWRPLRPDEGGSSTTSRERKYREELPAQLSSYQREVEPRPDSNNKWREEPPVRQFRSTVNRTRQSDPTEWRRSDWRIDDRASRDQLNRTDDVRQPPRLREQYVSKPAIDRNDMTQQSSPRQQAWTPQPRYLPPNRRTATPPQPTTGSRQELTPIDQLPTTSATSRDWRVTPRNQVQPIPVIDQDNARSEVRVRGDDSLEDRGRTASVARLERWKAEPVAVQPARAKIDRKWYPTR